MAPLEEMDPPKEKEWTLMFHFASDHSLAPDIVSQLKAIKQAGFHPEANVIVHFDPNPAYAETHVFDINHIDKFQAPKDQKCKIGFIGANPDEPFVVNLMADKLWRDDPKQKAIRQMIINDVKKGGGRDSLRNNGHVTGRGAAAVKGTADDEKEPEFNPPVPLPFRSTPEDPTKLRQKLEASDEASGKAKTSDDLTPKQSLDNFLKFCKENYPAGHYMLFIVGHGVVVGNDTFLFDENAPEHSLNLPGLRTSLDKFNEELKGKLELISFHSCSMSSLEVACQLEGTANYMLASQSPSFVGSWPYRQILIEIFNYLNSENDVKSLMSKICHYCWVNSFDFLVAGYPSDLCLLDLTRVKGIKDPISELSARLIEGLKLKDTRIRECVLLAHLDAQSYFNENYTDVYDFCFRLERRLEKSAKHRPLPSKAGGIIKACLKVRGLLESPKQGVRGKDNQLIVRSDFVGSLYQYSHGLSVYFPWSAPIKSKFWPDEYDGYTFIADARKKKKTTWSDFLETYFYETRRRTRAGEFIETGATDVLDENKEPVLLEVLLEAFTTGALNGNGQLGPDGPVKLDEPVKPDPATSWGAGCSCESIKNYPRFTREPKRGAPKRRKIPMPTTLSLGETGTIIDHSGVRGVTSKA